jgi:signal transduction histidine kinase
MSRLAKLPRKSRGIVSFASPTATAAGRKMRSRQLSQSSPDHAPNTSSSSPGRPERMRNSARSRASGEAVEALSSRTSIPTKIDISVDRLPAAVEATAYFIVAEALTNIDKHSRAERAEVTVRMRNGTVEIRVRDDGIGGARPDGSGLVGLRDRVEALGGTMTIDSPEGRGTTLVATLPLDG